MKVTDQATVCRGCRYPMQWNDLVVRRVLFRCASPIDSDYRPSTLEHRPSGVNTSGTHMRNPSQHNIICFYHVFHS